MIQRLRSVMAAANKQRVLIGLLQLCMVFGSRNRAFLSVENLLNILTQATPVSLVAIGMTVVILRGGIDLSVGSIVALSGLAFGYADQHGVPLLFSIFLAVLVGGTCGAANGSLIAIAKVPPFIATLGMMSAIRGVSL